uniref:HVA22-like protein n=1 Tax=Araucaria cunninghamii TaxID=56994 RepID=A0A0D6R929_ARACU
MALLSSSVAGEVGLRLLLSPLGSNIVVKTACCTVGVCFPVYSTFKAIESKSKEDQDQWLVYWAVYGSFSIVELFSDKLLSWFPLYYHVKLAFLIWLQLPPSYGSRQLYVRYLRPFLLKHQSRLDQIAAGTSIEISRFLSAHQREIQLMKVVLQKSFIAAYQVLQDFLRPSEESTGDARDDVRRDAIEDTRSNSD